mmetsp:Transcript_28607/g.34846  ORF Transcript_28607/g.34846 Transcript_28607/m.34846 type:complete len:892 (+) Transcript_28607:79-2754(+)|eukprot:CAMPEP_0172506692 /NCGR_PEP_ID=MMETSP1066-20121228/197384_1 /TAXON_ID=671091 /ORGANISM="Coscinodiscus wailesii, Strain CCMP2513" /LENGTH=891 /DNA_ID=CAMNT_0013283839 /DNA_START=78 /DNA_END=2753 /DNA_ORIENTATION=-
MDNVPGPLSNLPDEQDRKRIIGCLAAVLGASYSYDVDEGESSILQYDSFSNDDDFAVALDTKKSFIFRKKKKKTEVDDKKKPDEEEISKRKKTRKELDDLAVQRHRRRRHELLSKMLQTACGLLFLEKMHAAAYAPLLSKLLYPSSSSAESASKLRRASIDGTSTNTETAPPDIDLKAVSSCNDIPSESACTDTKNQKKSTSCEDKNFNEMMRYIDPFVSTLSPGAGFKSIALLILHHLLMCPEGYDPRIRYAFKKLAVIVISYDIAEKNRKASSSSSPNGTVIDVSSYSEIATRKFEALEHAIAIKLVAVTEGIETEPAREGPETAEGQVNTLTRSRLMRGLKIGSAGVVAGTLFAITGGLAAPAIAAGISTIAGTSAVAAVAGTSAVAAVAVTALGHTMLVTTIFGVGGGGLAAYKMDRRTKGLTELEFLKSSSERDELFTTVCVSGWLKNKYDFEASWGVEPSSPPVENRVDLLRRFLSVYSPEDAVDANAIYYRKWKRKEKELWDALRDEFGRDPDNLYPIGQKEDLTDEEDMMINNILEELGYNPSRIRSVARKVTKNQDPKDGTSSENISERNEEKNEKVQWRIKLSERVEPTDQPAASPTNEDTASQSAPSPALTKIPRAWDYQSQFAGELYTVKWESVMLLDICNSVADLAKETVQEGTKEFLKHTILATLVTAVAIPAALVKVAGLIDETWSVTIARAEEAGVELAKCLLASQAGHRPVTLVGFSMGVRLIYSCLRELARLQEIWEEQRHVKNGKRAKNKKDMLEREPASIVEDVIFMGAPLHLDVRTWQACRRIVAGRFINCYSKKDMILALMFTYKQPQGAHRSICGISPVNVGGVENYDVSSLISYHSDYCTKANDILRMVKHGQPQDASRYDEYLLGN